MIAVALALVLRSLPCRARLVNVTIDDMYGDARTGLKPEYSPLWNGFSLQDPHLAGNKWDASQIYNETLHFPDSYSKTGGNVSLTFDGTTIYVFFVDSFVEESDADSAEFYMDDDSVPVWRYLSSPTDSTRYNILAFERDGLSQSRHQLLVHFLPGSRSFFDYAVYTMDDLTGGSPAQSPASQSAPTSSTGSTDAAKSTEATPARPSNHHSDAATSGRASETRNGALESFSEFPSPALPSPSARSHAPLNLGVVVGVPTAAGTLMVAMCACFAHWQRRRRSRRSAGPEDSAPAQQEEAITPFTAQPGTVPAERKWRRRDAETYESVLTSGGSSQPPADSISDPPPTTPTPGAAAKSRPESPPSRTPAAGMSSSDDVMAELERVRAESARAQSAYERVRAEIQMLRQALAPPPYPIAE